MRVARGLIEEQVLHDQQFQRFQRLLHVQGVGVGLGDVLALDEHRLEPAGDGGVEHVGDPHARYGLQMGAPQRLELFAYHVVGDVPVAGQLVRERSHVTGALHVVLPAQRVDTYPVAADVAGRHGQVRHRHHHGGALRMLGDAEAVVDRGVGSGGVQPCCTADLVGRHTGELLDGFGAVLRAADEFLPLPVQLGVAAAHHERQVGQLFVDDDVCHRVDDGHVGARPQLQVVLGADVR